MAEPGSLERVLELLLAHGAIKIAYGHIWVGNAAVGTDNQWNDLIELARNE